MPTDERATKSAERCDLHPGRPSVARCQGCGRPLCLTCAVPVRGRVLGTECLAEALGPDAPQTPARPPGPRSAAPVVGAGFALGLFATALPWSRFGEGSGVFGAWGQPDRWSMMVVVAVVVGLALWATVFLRSRRARRAWDAVFAGLAALAGVGAVLSILNPPPFTHAWLGSWLALLAALVVLFGSAASWRGHSAPKPGDS